MSYKDNPHFWAIFNAIVVVLVCFVLLVGCGSSGMYDTTPSTPKPSWQTVVDPENGQLWRCVTIGTSTTCVQK